MGGPILRFLLEKGVDANPEFGARAWPPTLLSRGAYSLKPHDFKLLLDYGARPDASAIHICLRRQNFDVQKARISQVGRTRPYWPRLSEGERYAMVSMLLDAGADPNVFEYGFHFKATSSARPCLVETPLHMAKRMEDLRIVDLLHERGADKDEAHRYRRSDFGPRMFYRQGNSVLSGELK